MAQHAGAPVVEQMNDFAAPVPRLRCLRRSAISEHRVERQIEDLLLAVDMPIKAHHARTDAIGQPAHRQSVDAFGVQQFHCARHDAFKGKRRFTARLLPGVQRHICPSGTFAWGVATFGCHLSSSLVIASTPDRQCDLEGLTRAAYDAI